MTICVIVSITVTTATIALWLKQRMKHISSRGPYLSSRKAANSASLLSPYKSCSSLHLWNDALIVIPVFSLALSSSFFFAFLVSHFICSLWRGQWWGIFLLCCCCLFSTIVYSLSLNVSDQVGAGTVRGRGTAQYTLREGGGPPPVCMRMTDTSQTLPLAPIGCVDPERWILVNQIIATGWSHRQWIFTQLICILFYCQIIMTILADITEKQLQTTTLGTQPYTLLSLKDWLFFCSVVIYYLWNIAYLQFYVRFLEWSIIFSPFQCILCRIQKNYYSNLDWGFW